MTKRVLEDIKLNKNNNSNTAKTVDIPIVKTFNKPEVKIEPKPESKPTITPIVETKTKEEVKTEINLEKKSESITGNKYEFLKKHSSFNNSNKRISYTPQMPSKRRFNKIILYAFIISIILGVFYLFSTTFFIAKVTVVPKSKIFNLDGQEFLASKKNGVPFEVMIVDDTESKSVVLTSSREASDKAKGQITLYNSYSNKPVKFTAGTFISDEKGKSYKIDTAVSVPGYITKDSKIIPGEAVVSITSFLPGEAYNGSPEMFYINSFKNTDKYKKIYGKVKSPLVGGALGSVYFVDDGEKEKILSNVTTSRDKLLKKMNALVPEGYILYKDAVNYSYNIDPNFLSKTPNTKIDIHGNLSAILLKREELASLVIDKQLPDINRAEKKEILEPDLSSLSFNFTDKNFIINKEVESFEFELKGNLTLDWNPDVNKLQTSLVGKNKADIPNIFKQDPGITSASVKIIPFWAKKVPLKTEKINIIMKK